MARAYLDVVPELLPLIPALLPRGANIFGAKDQNGSIRLVLEGNDLPDGKLLQMVVTEKPLEKKIVLKVVNG